MATYPRLMLVACTEPRTVRAMLRGNEHAVRVSSLGENEWIDLELEAVGLGSVRSRISSNGEHSISTGFAAITVTKSGSGSPTTVELLHNA